MSLPEHVSVLVVGGGPVGLSLAADLGWRCVQCLLVEQTDGAIDQPKINSLNMRTMEFCRRWGIADELRRVGFPDDYANDAIFVTSLAGHLLARKSIPAARDMKTPPFTPEKEQRCPQTIFDPVLRDLAAGFPSVALRYQTRCESVAQDEDGVTARLRDMETGTIETVQADYVVSCEGVRSTIRDALNIAMTGAEKLIYSINILVHAPDLLECHDKGPGRFYVAIGPEGPWASMVPIDGHTVWRIHVNGSDDPSSWNDIDPEDSVRRFVGTDLPFEIQSVTPWIRRHLVADRYRDGRIFLAGDAAHQLSPDGAFGMNTGVCDAVDLAWKLQGVTEGWGGPVLLDSYEIERRPIGVRNVDEAATRMANMMTPAPMPALLDDGPEGERQRKAMADRIMHGPGELQPGSAGIQLGYIYDGSPICAPDGTPHPADERRSYTPTSWPGARAPHVWLADGRSTLDLFGRGFVLLRLGGQAPDPAPLAEAARRRGIALEIVVLDQPAVTDSYERPLVLVRPDGHVAWRGDTLPSDCRGLIDRVRVRAKAEDVEAVAPNYLWVIAALLQYQVIA